MLVQVEEAHAKSTLEPAADNSATNGNAHTSGNARDTPQQRDTPQPPLSGDRDRGSTAGLAGTGGELNPKP